MAATFQHTRWSDIAPEPMSPQLTRQFVSGSQALMARIVLKQGCTVARHVHANEQIVYIESGALRFLLGAEGSAQECVVRSGEVLVIPGGLPHSAEALEDTVDFDLFAPPRADWLRGDDSYLRGA